MTKTKSNIKTNFIYGLAMLLSVSVLLLSVHAKDIVAFHDATVTSKIEYKDISAKAAKELHDHVDKQVLKNKSSDATSNYLLAIRSREEAGVYEDEDPGLWGRFHETLLIWRVYISMPFAAIA